MSKELIRERILSDAQKEADEILKNAEEKAAAIIAEASSRADAERAETEKEIQEKSDFIYEKREAAARLESAKILLSEKRKVLDGIYALALERLNSLDKENALSLSERLLNAYAEEGDELFFDEAFKYVEQVALLPVIGAKKLKISQTRVKIGGGFLLKGEKADKDLSYVALLSADREANQADLAREIF